MANQATHEMALKSKLEHMFAPLEQAPGESLKLPTEYSSWDQVFCKNTSMPSAEMVL